MGGAKNRPSHFFLIEDIGQKHFGNAFEIPTVTVTNKYYIALWYIIFTSQILIMHAGNGT